MSRKITIFKNLLPFPIRSKSLNIETKNLIHFIQANKQLLQLIKRLRKKYNIPQNGFVLRKLYESVDIRAQWIKDFSIDKNEEYYSIVFEEEGWEDFYNELYKNKYSKRKIKKLDEFYESLSARQKKALERHENAFGKKKNTSSDENGFNLMDLETKMRKDIVKLTRSYSLIEDEEISLFLLIAFNSFLEVNTKTDFSFLMDKKEIVEEVGRYNQPLGAILIDRQTSKRKLKGWIDDNWFYISRELKNLPKPHIKRSKILEISKEIYSLREKLKLSYKDISNRLSEKYLNDDRIYDEGWIKQTYHRYKRMLHEYLKRNKT